MLSFYTVAMNLAKRNLTTFSSPLNIQFTNILCAEPLKKKKRLNPAVVKQREERKRRKIEKQIKRLEKHEQQLKMISECEVPHEIIDSPQLFSRSIQTSIDTNYKVLSLKEWSRIRQKQHVNDSLMIQRILESQINALRNLESESPTLYKAAINSELDFLPWKATGPVETPPIEDYDSPDGEYIDISKKWDSV